MRQIPAIRGLKHGLNPTYKARMRIRILSAVLTLGLLAAPAAAQNREVPYWATIKHESANLRVGPSQEYKIEWVYKRQGLPIKVIRVVEGWRLIEDSDGTKGWVSRSQLSPSRSGLVIGEGVTAIRAEPSSAAKLKWNIQPGVVGYLGECNTNWCELDVRGHKGWVAKERLWGPGEP